MRVFKKDTLAIVTKKNIIRNIIPLSKNRQLAQKTDKSTRINPKKGAIEIE